jgi:hypothetical protein
MKSYKQAIDLIAIRVQDRQEWTDKQQDSETYSISMTAFIFDMSPSLVERDVYALVPAIKAAKLAKRSKVLDRWMRDTRADAARRAAEI